jgi:replication factor A2
VTLRQLLMAAYAPGDECLRVDDREVYNIRVVAQIVTAQETSTGYSMQLDDGTATMEARVWMDTSGGAGAEGGGGGGGGNYPQQQQQQQQSDYNVQHRGEWTEGVYVSLIGHPKIFQERRSIVAQRVRAVQDHNEITHHMLECLYVHLHNKRVTTATTDMMGLSSAPGYHAGNSYDYYAGAPASSSSAAAAAGFGGGDVGGGGGGFTPLQQAVLNLCRRPAPQGVPLQEILAQLASMGDTNAIRSAIQFLTDEGHLYTTIDDEHFKSTS